MKPVILLIGKVGSGKSTYAQRLAGTVCLSADEWMLRLFPEGCGADHDLYAKRTRECLYALAAKLSAAEVSVVLDWGFWGRELRQEAERALAGCPLDWRWVNPSPARRRAWIAGRNAAVTARQTQAYLVDAGLAEKCERLFEAPTREELPGLTVLGDAELTDAL